jgi:hypothetical protein
MSGIGEMFKKVPLPIWIGLGLVLIVILLMNRGGSSSQQQTTAATPTAAAGPVTNATVGTQGSQAGAGTDQELGNLSVLTQGGFAQIAQQEQGNQALLTQLAGGMPNVGTPMQQFGTSIQSSQNTSATGNATSGTVGQNAGSNPVPVATQSNH